MIDPSLPPRNPASLFFAHLGLREGWEQDRALAVEAQKERMLEAMARAVAVKGYAKVTVADVVALAGVSRRTFYEQFADKEGCFLEAYSVGSQALVDTVGAAVRRSGRTDWHDRVRIGLRCYTRLLASDPHLARALLVDVLGAGPRAVDLRRDVFSRFVDLFRPSPIGTRPADVAMRAVPETLLRGLVGGIAELVAEHIVTRGAESLEDLTPALVELAFSIFELGTAGLATAEQRATPPLTPAP